MNRNTLVERSDTDRIIEDDRSVPDRWKQCLYIYNEHVVLPEPNIKASLEHAGSKLHLDHSVTAKQLITNELFLDDAYPNLYTGTPLQRLSATSVEGISGSFDEQAAQVKELGFELNVQAVSSWKGKMVRVRPCFKQWAIGFNFQVYHHALTLARLQEVFNRAGVMSGVGDYRPSSPKRPGPFGRFKAQVYAGHLGALGAR